MKLVSFSYFFCQITAVKYEDTNDYYWPLLSTKDDTAYVTAESKALAIPDTRGPFGFGDAVQLKENKVRTHFH